MEIDEKLEQARIMEMAIALAKYIPVLAGTAGTKATKWLTANVDSVDEANRTCNVTGILDESEIKYSDVNLSSEQNDGFILIPAIDSTVFVAIMPDTEKYVIQTSDITKVICYIDSSNYYTFDTTSFSWNGGANGGIAKTLSVANQLNLIESRVNLISADLLAIATAAGATTTTPVTGATLSGFITGAIANIATPLTLSTQAGISNTKIKH